MCNRFNILFLFIFINPLIMNMACSGGSPAWVLIAGDISGPDSVDELSSADFSVTASGDTGITYSWVADPTSSGTFINATSAACTFNAAEVTADTPVTISVTVNSEHAGPIIKTKTIIVEDIPVVSAGWARTWGSTDLPDSASCVVIGSGGNIIVAGSFWGTLDSDPGTSIDNHTSIGRTDIFLVCYDQTGDYLWGCTWGGTQDDFVADIALDGTGNIYVTGHYWGAVDFDPGTPVEECTSAGHYDTFLSVFDPAGNFQWMLSWGGADEDRSRDIAIDGAGNIYVLGTFTGTVDLDPGTGSSLHTSDGNRNHCLTKFNSVGNFLWADTWGNSEYVSNIYSALDVDSSGNAVVAGQFTGAIDFDPGVGTVTEMSGVSTYDFFMSYFNPSGAFQWVRTWGGPNYDSPSDIILLDAGVIYLCGTFESSVDFDTGTGTDIHTANGAADVFLARYDSSGNFQWARTWGGPDGLTGADGSGKMAIDSAGLIYITGSFFLTCDFDPGSGTATHTADANPDCFLSVFNSDGDFQWVNTWGKPGTSALGFGIAVDSAGNSCVVGNFSGTVDFDPGTTTDNHSSVGNPSDAFLVRFLPDSSW